MKKLALLITVLLFMNMFAVAPDSELFYVLDKKIVFKEGRTVFKVVLVRSSYNPEDYKNIEKYPRINIVTQEDVYDSIVKSMKYTIQELLYIGLDVPAEQQETMPREARVENPFASKTDPAAAIGAMEQRAESLKESAASVVDAFGEVDSDDITELKSSAQNFLKKKQELLKNNKVSEQDMLNLESEIRFAEELLRITNIYNAGLIYKDNEDQEIKLFFEKITGRNDIEIKGNNNIGLRIMIGIAVGLMLGLFGIMISAFVLDVSSDSVMVLITIVCCITGVLITLFLFH